MPRFRFELQTVLDLRQRRQDETGRELSEARRRMDDAAQARSTLEDLRAVGLAQLSRAHGAGGQVGHIQNLAHAVGRVEERIRQADEGCREAEVMVQASMDTFGRAYAERRSLEQLREKKMERWQADQIRAEQKAMDELGQVGHVRRGAAASGGVGR